MRITDFRVLVSKHEGLKKEVDIAQISEILRVIDTLSHGALYKWVRQYDPRYDK